MDSKALLLTEAAIVFTCLFTFVAVGQVAPEPSASPLSSAGQVAPEPSASPVSSSSSSSLCTRALATTLWGAAFAFFSLMTDAWPAAKVLCSIESDGSLLGRVVVFYSMGPLHPVVGMFLGFQQMFITLRFRKIHRRSSNPELGPDTQALKSAKIIANTYVVLGMSESTNLPGTHINTYASQVEEGNVADALTLGEKRAVNSCLTLLNEAGKLALLETSILSNCKKLRFLEGRGGIATLLIVLQAIGYVISTGFRAICHLPVSPIEAIGFAFSIFVIVHSVVHIWGVLCQSPLVVYLNPMQEQEMLDKCLSTRWSAVDDVFCRIWAIVGMVVVGSVVVAFTTLVEWQVFTTLPGWQVGSFNSPELRAIFNGPILFLFSLTGQLCFYSVTLKCPGFAFLEYGRVPNLTSTIFYLCITFSWAGILLSTMYTILHWQTNKFDSRTPYVIRIFPFLG